MNGEIMTESASPMGQEGFSQGYHLGIDVLPDGFRVSDPEPLHAAPNPDEQESEPELVPDLTTALKHVVAVVKAHPIAPSEQDSFQSGLPDQMKTPASKMY